MMKIFSYKRKFEKYFYEILLLYEILVKYVCFKILKFFHLKIYYMKISNMEKNRSTVVRSYTYIRSYLLTSL